MRTCVVLASARTRVCACVCSSSSSSSLYVCTHVDRAAPIPNARHSYMQEHALYKARQGFQSGKQHVRSCAGTTNTRNAAVWNATVTRIAAVRNACPIFVAYPHFFFFVLLPSPFFGGLLPSFFNTSSRSRRFSFNARRTIGCRDSGCFGGSVFSTTLGPMKPRFFRLDSDLKGAESPGRAESKIRSLASYVLTNRMASRKSVQYGATDRLG
mmetsp:Transcript_34543/g.57168  ORF Transcript_34543/g.57168 Transcript_34543/m.57168 type:complete len:212 (-) Transcript_34543:90-725(-)